MDFEDRITLYPDNPDSGFSFVNSFVHIYLLALGAFDVDHFSGEGLLQESWIRSQLLAATFIIQITFMNMLIAIMQNIFD